MGKSKNQNPYRGERYKRIFDNFRAKTAGNRFISRQMLIEDEVKASGCSVSASSAAVGVILSPTESSDRGDCRGNMSAMGHVYFAARKPEQTEGKGRKMVYSIRWRKEPMEPRHREKTVIVETPEVEAKVKDVVEISETSEV